VLDIVEDYAGRQTARARVVVERVFFAGVG